MSASRHHLSFASVLVRQSGPGDGGAHRAQAHLERPAEQRRHVAQLVAQDHRQRLLHRRVHTERERQADHARQTVDGRPGGAHLLGAQLGDRGVSQLPQGVRSLAREEAPLSRLWQGLLRQVQRQAQGHRLVVAHREGARLRPLLPQGEDRRAQAAGAHGQHRQPLLVQHEQQHAQLARHIGQQRRHRSQGHRDRSGDHRPHHLCDQDTLRRAQGVGATLVLATRRRVPRMLGVQEALRRPATLAPLSLVRQRRVQRVLAALAAGAVARLGDARTRLQQLRLERSGQLVTTHAFIHFIFFYLSTIRKKIYI